MIVLFRFLIVIDQKVKGEQSHCPVCSPVANRKHFRFFLLNSIFSISDDCFNQDIKCFIIFAKSAVLIRFDRFQASFVIFESKQAVGFKNKITRVSLIKF